MSSLLLPRPVLLSSYLLSPNVPPGYIHRELRGIPCIYIHPYTWNSNYSYFPRDNRAWRKDTDLEEREELCHHHRRQSDNFPDIPYFRNRSKAIGEAVRVECNNDRDSPGR